MILYFYLKNLYLNIMNKVSPNDLSFLKKCLSHNTKN